MAQGDAGGLRVLHQGHPLCGEPAGTGGSGRFREALPGVGRDGAGAAAGAVPLEFGKFLELLPRELDGIKLRHVVEPRHPSFCTPAFIALLREFSIPAVFAEHETYPAIPDPVGDFVYLRLQKGKDDIKTGYPPKALDQWAERAKAWAKGGVPKDLELIDPKSKAKAEPRDVFVYFIHEGKVRAPAAAMELIKRL
jgi:uncharacterized protein YecE (DUF72 family)